MLYSPIQSRIFCLCHASLLCILIIQQLLRKEAGNLNDIYLLHTSNLAQYIPVAFSIGTNTFYHPFFPKFF